MSPPTPHLESKQTPTVDTTLDAELLECSQPPLDLREWLLPLVGLAVGSPLCLNLIGYTACSLALLACVAFPRLVRLAFPNFMTVNILDDLRLQAGLTLSLCGAYTALILQTHNPSIALALKNHSATYTKLLPRLLRTFLFVELALNGSSEEKEQTASWVRWMHRNVHGPITPEMQKELALSEDVTVYGYMDELKAFVIESLAFATLSFQTRFGRE